MVFSWVKILLTLSIALTTELFYNDSYEIRTDVIKVIFVWSSCTSLSKLESRWQSSYNIFTHLLRYVYPMALRFILTEPKPSRGLGGNFYTISTWQGLKMSSSLEEPFHLVIGIVGVLLCDCSPSEASVIINYCESELTFIECLPCARIWAS